MRERERKILFLFEVPRESERGNVLRKELYLAIRRRICNLESPSFKQVCT